MVANEAGVLEIDLLVISVGLIFFISKLGSFSRATQQETSTEKDEINVPIAPSAFRDGDQGPSKVTKTTSTAVFITFKYMCAET